MAEEPEEEHSLRSLSPRGSRGVHSKASAESLVLPRLPSRPSLSFGSHADSQSSTYHVRQIPLPDSESSIRSGDLPPLPSSHGSSISEAEADSIIDESHRSSIQSEDLPALPSSHGSLNSEVEADFIIDGSPRTSPIERNSYLRLRDSDGQDQERRSRGASPTRPSISRKESDKPRYPRDPANAKADPTTYTSRTAENGPVFHSFVEYANHLEWYGFGQHNVPTRRLMTRGRPTVEATILDISQAGVKQSDYQVGRSSIVIMPATESVPGKRKQRLIKEFQSFSGTRGSANPRTRLMIQPRSTFESQRPGDPTSRFTLKNQGTFDSQRSDGPTRFALQQRPTFASQRSETAGTRFILHNRMTLDSQKSEKAQELQPVIIRPRDASSDSARNAAENQLVITTRETRRNRNEPGRSATHDRRVSFSKSRPQALDLDGSPSEDQEQPGGSPRVTPYSPPPRPALSLRREETGSVGFRRALKDDTDGSLTLRVILVESLNEEVINVLGEEFDLDPEFFIDFLQGSSRDQQNGVDAFSVVAQTIDKSVEFDDDSGNTRSFPGGNSQTTFIQTRAKHEKTVPFGVRYHGGLRRTYQSMEWYKVVALKELRGSLPEDHTETFRECFCPDTRITSQSSSSKMAHMDPMFDDIGNDKEETLTRTMNPAIHKLLSSGSLMGLLSERTSMCELRVGTLSTVIILCDAAPMHDKQFVYDLWQRRGSWLQTKDDYSTALGRSQSTKVTLAAWISEHARRNSYDGSKPWTVLPFITEMAARDSFSVFDYTKARARRMQSEMNSSSSVRQNLSVWREWLGGSSERISRVIDSIQGFKINTDTRSSSRKRWTALEVAQQARLCPRITYYIGARAHRHERADASDLEDVLGRNKLSTEATLRTTDELLRTTLSLMESERAISEAQSVTKLTELAFIFIPLSFTASFFSMPLDLLGGTVTLGTFATLAIVLLVGAYSLRLLIRAGFVHDTAHRLTEAVRRDQGLSPDEKISTHTFTKFIAKSVGEYIATNPIIRYQLTQSSFISGLPGFLLVSGWPLILLWTLFHGDTGLKAGLTVVLFFIWVSIFMFDANLTEVSLGYEDTRMSHWGLSMSQAGGIRLPDSDDESDELVSRRISLLWLLRVGLVLSAIIAPFVVIWVLLPRNIGAQVGLTIAALFACSFLWLALASVLNEDPVGAKLVVRIERKTGQLLDAVISCFPCASIKISAGLSRGQIENISDADLQPADLPHIPRSEDGAGEGASSIQHTSTQAQDQTTSRNGENESDSDTPQIDKSRLLSRIRSIGVGTAAFLMTLLFGSRIGNRHRRRHGSYTGDYYSDYYTDTTTSSERDHRQANPETTAGTVRLQEWVDNTEAATRERQDVPVSTALVLRQANR